MTVKDPSHKKHPQKKKEEHLEEEVSQAAEPTRDPSAELLKQCDDYLAGWKRAQADYQNLQRETAKRVSDTVQYANEALLIELLPIVDYFHYAFKGIPESERNSNWLKGIEHIRTNFMKVLEEHDVKMIPTVGERFNPEFHEAVEEVEGEGAEAGMIAEEVSPGFTLHSRVIRSAKVKITKS